MDRQEQTTLDPIEAHQQAETYRQTNSQQYDQSYLHQHEDATQALQNIAHPRNRQLLPTPTNSLASQDLPQFSYEAASLHGLYVSLPSYLPPHQQIYDTSFMVSPSYSMHSGTPQTNLPSTDHLRLAPNPRPPSRAKTTAPATRAAPSDLNTDTGPPSRGTQTVAVPRIRPATIRHRLGPSTCWSDRSTASR